MGMGDDLSMTEFNMEKFDGRTIRNWVMEAKTEENTYLFQSVEPGQKG